MRRFGNSGLIAEEIVGIQGISLAEPPTTAVNLVAALLHHNVENRTAVVAVFCGETIVLHFELLDDFHRRRIVHIGVSTLPLLRRANGGTVEANFRSRVPLAIRNEVGS